MKIKRPICINHSWHEPLCTLDDGGECSDPYYEACIYFQAVPYECLNCSKPYNHDDVPEVCIECGYVLTEEDKEKEWIE